MTSVNQYRVRIIAPPSYAFVWGTTEPTVGPNGEAIDTSLTAIVQTVSSNDTVITNLPLSSFGEVAVEQMTPLIQLYFTYGNISQTTSNSTTGSGSTSNVDGMGIVSSGAAINSSACLFSLKPIKYRIGQGIVIRFTSIFTAGVAGNTQMVGGFDDDNGLGFGFNGTDFGLFRRSSTVTTWVSQTAWNLDPLDGTGPSGLSISFGDGDGNVFQIQFQYLGFGALKFFVENPSTGMFINVHTIQYSNTAIVPSFRNASFPLSIQTINTTNNTNIEIKTASMMAGVEGQIIYTGPQFTSIWNNVAVANGVETFISAFQVKTIFGSIPNKVIVYLTFASFATGDTDKTQILRLRKGATFAGAIWTDVDAAQSCVERLTGGTWNAGTGDIVLQQNITGKGFSNVINIEPSPSSLFLVAGDNLVITLEGLGAGSNWGSLSWLEDQ